MPLVLVAVAGAIIGGATLASGWGRWGLLGSIAVLQVAAHVLTEPAAGQRSFGHAHGVAGQVANVDMSVFADHVTGSAVAMVALHVCAFALAAILAGAAEPLLRLLLRVSTVERPPGIPTRLTLPRLMVTHVVGNAPTSLTHSLVRRGPPAFV